MLASPPKTGIARSGGTVSMEGQQPFVALTTARIGATWTVPGIGQTNQKNKTHRSQIRAHVCALTNKRREANQ